MASGRKGQAALLGVELEEGVGGLRVGDREDDQQRDQEHRDRGPGPDRGAEEDSAGDARGEDEDRDRDPGSRLAE